MGQWHLTLVAADSQQDKRCTKQNVRCYACFDETVRRLRDPMQFLPTKLQARAYIVALTHGTSE
eukprot:4172835-Amphidinium_carterae.1